MKSGNIKKIMKKNKKPIIISIGKNGVGEENHPLKINNKKTDDYEKIIDDIIELKKNPIELKKEISKKKLYLNRVINLLNNRKKKKYQKNSLYQRFLHRFFILWRHEKTNDLIDLLKFIIIHGCIGFPVLVAILTIINADIVLIQYIKNIKWLTAVIYFLSSGSAYYLLLDCSKALQEQWGKRSK